MIFHVTKFNFLPKAIIWGMYIGRELKQVLKSTRLIVEKASSPRTVHFLHMVF